MLSSRRTFAVVVYRVWRPSPTRSHPNPISRVEKAERRNAFSRVMNESTRPDCSNFGFWLGGAFGGHSSGAMSFAGLNPGWLCHFPHQLGQPNEVIGRARQGEYPADPGEAPVTGSCESRRLSIGSPPTSRHAAPIIGGIHVWSGRPQRAKSFRAESRAAQYGQKIDRVRHPAAAYLSVFRHRIGTPF